MDQFAHSAAHELRAPLRAINGRCAILLDDHGSTVDEEVRTAIEQIARNAGKLNHLLESLLAFSHAGRANLKAEPVALAPLAQEVRAEFQEELTSRDVQFRIGELPTVWADRALVRQVYINLVSNALKFSRGKTPAVVEIGSARRESQTVLYVRDNGIGFDEKLRHKLFQPFERLHSSSEYQGSGVGLSLVQRIVERHGGKIWAESSTGNGAAFFFTPPEQKGQS